jgi:hypothetical protein
LLDVIQKATNIPIEQFKRTDLLEGAREVDIVYAGLEEIMSDAADKVVRTALDKKLDMRTAAFVNAINSMHEYYELTGVSN